MCPLGSRIQSFPKTHEKTWQNLSEASMFSSLGKLPYLREWIRGALVNHLEKKIPPRCQPGRRQLWLPAGGHASVIDAQLRKLFKDTFTAGRRGPRWGKTVQILIGLIHLGFGSVLLMVRRGHVGMLFIEGGVPFWGGACFVISGSLSVAAEKSHTSCLVRSSLGTNILSAMAAFAGTAILLMDFGVTNWDVGRGYLAVLTIFTILEFFIAVIATHFGCQATRAQANTPVIFLPNAFSTDFNIPSPAASPPPAYDNVAYMPKESSE